MIDRPLVLISQIQRSGGTLLSQLLEGHPECRGYPHELYLGRPKWDWLDLPMDATPDTWFGLLFDARLERLAREGYSKAGLNVYARAQVLPFTFDVDRFRTHFLDACQQEPPVRSQRDVLNKYFGAFFRTWADRQDSGAERYIVAFTPRVQMMPASLARYRRDYPDGRMLSVVRDPLTWFASASRHDLAEYSSVERAMDLWRASAEASMQLEVARRGAALVLLYEDLVQEPMLVMSSVARFLGIAWNDGLLRPTYCGHLMIANSSFLVRHAGLTLEPLGRPVDLPLAARSYIAETAEPLYRAYVDQLRAARPVATRTA